MFFRIPDGLTAEDRMLAVLEFYLTSFHAGRKVSHFPRLALVKRDNVRQNLVAR